MLNKRDSSDESYLRMAIARSRRSQAVRKQVGALIVLDGQIISDGYNGRLSGSVDESCETQVDGLTVTHPEVVHAEMNAILKLASGGGRGCAGATLYVSMSPCMACSSSIIQSKIKKIVYNEQYRDTSAITHLENYGVEIIQMEIT